MIKRHLLAFFGEARVVGLPLSDTLRTDGKRELNRALTFMQNGSVFVCPAGKVTDYSSYPRVFLVYLLTVAALALVWCGALWGPLVFLCIRLVPAHEQTAYAGVRHDCETDNIPLNASWLPTALRAAKNWAGTALSGAPHAAPWQVIPSWIGLSTFGLLVVLGKNIKQGMKANG